MTKDIEAMITRRNFLVRCLTTGVALSLTQRSSLWSDSLIWRTAPLRVGIIGLDEAGMSNLDHCLSTKEVTVSALCDLRSDALAIAAGRFGKVVPAYRDYHALLARPDLDAVTIGVPSSERAAIIATACKAGKHVYVGPPWAATVSDSEQLLRIATTGAALVYQERVDDRWDADALHEFIRDNEGPPTALHITLYRQEVTNVSSGLQTFTDTFDQMGLAQKLLGTGMPATISAIRGLDSTYGPTRLTAAVRLHFKDVGADRESKSLIVQKGYGSGAVNDKLLAHITTAHPNGRSFEYVVELSEKDATVSQSGWKRFLKTLQEPSSNWIPVARNTHLSNSYVLLSEQALKSGTGVVAFST